jgi:hypothetical protein
VPGAFPGFGQAPPLTDTAPFAGAATTTAAPWYRRVVDEKPRLLIGAVVVVVVAGGAALAVPKLLSPSDPGCRSYAGTAIDAYDQAISDLNTHAPQSKLTGDITTAIADLTAAADQAKSVAVKSALANLTTELNTVREDAQKGPVSAQTVAALNNAANAADNAC